MKMADIERPKMDPRASAIRMTPRPATACFFPRRSVRTVICCAKITEELTPLIAVGIARLQKEVVNGIHNMVAPIMKAFTEYR